MSSRARIGVIGIPGGWSTEALAEHLRKQQAGGDIIELSRVSADLETGTYHCHGQDLAEFDGFIIKKLVKKYSPALLDKLDLLEGLEQTGTRCFSSAACLRTMTSRLACTLRLQAAGIPMPPTFISQDAQAAVRWAAAHLPVILKPLYSTKAQGMILLSSEAQAKEAISALAAAGGQTIYLQKKFDIEDCDHALAFLGGEYLGAYARIGDGSTWHTTTRTGGRYGPSSPSQEIIDLAERAQQPFGLDFACVDVAISREVGPIVFEVSAFGGFKGLQQGAGINAAERVTNYAIGELAAG